MSELIGRDLYFRRIYDGKPGPVLHVRVWDADRFLHAEHTRGNSEKLKPEDRYLVEPSTEGAYQRERRR